jgi:hypothetical protein
VVVVKGGGEVAAGAVRADDGVGVVVRGAGVSHVVVVWGFMLASATAAKMLVAGRRPRKLIN